MANDSAVRPTQTYWVREVLSPRGRPQTPTDPDWKLFSSVVTTTEPESEKEDRNRRGLGDVDYIDKNQAQESHSLTVEYELERFPVDAAGDPIDPVADAASRQTDGRLSDTHSVLQVVQETLRADSTVHAKFYARDGAPAHPTGSTPDATARATRKNHYFQGGHPEEVPVGADASDNALVIVEFQYLFDKFRPYQFDQLAPGSGSEFLHVASTASADTDVEVMIESVDGSASDTVTTDGSDGTTAIATSVEFPDFGRVWTADEHEGQITVFDDDGSGSGSGGAPEQLLGVVKGTSRYDGVDYDRGVPPVGAGSFDDGSSLESKQYAIGAQALWNGDPLADVHQGTSLTISNEIGEEAATDLGLEMAHQAGGREITAETTAFGETASIDHVNDFFEGREGAYVLRLTDGDIELPRAFISEGGNQAREQGEAFLLPEVTFMGLADPDAGTPAIEFSRA